MNDEQKTKAQLINELAELRRKVIQVEAAETERKRAEESLRESEERFRAFYDLGLVGLTMTSPDKGWVNVNPCLCTMLGYTQDELRRMTWAQLTHPADLAADVEQFERLLSGAIEGYAMEKRFVSRSGAIVFTQLVVRCVRKPDRSVDYVVAMVEDITEKKISEFKVHEIQKKFQSLVETINDFIWEMDLNGVYNYCSPQIAYLSIVSC